jgi:hypothetical protein
VSDSGIGLSAEELTKLSKNDPFTQVCFRVRVRVRIRVRVRVRVRVKV